MTTTTLTHARPERSRIIAVTRLIFVNPTTVLWAPLLIMASIFGVNYAVWALIAANVESASDRADVAEGLGYSGSSAFIFVYMLVVAVQAINSTFPFAQGYGVTRRDFFLGSSLAFIMLSVGLSILCTVLAAIESGTDGWGVGGRMFTAVYFGDSGGLERFWVFLATFLFCFFVGAATAAAYVRWHALGMYVLFGTATVAIVGAAAIITASASWPVIGEWLGRTGAGGLAAWSLILTAVSAVTGYLILRRATPRG